MKHLLTTILCLLAALPATWANHSNSTPLPGIFDDNGILGQSAGFGRRTAVLQLGYGFFANNNYPLGERQATLGPVSVLFEKSAFRNVSIGAYTALRLWQVPKSQYKYSYLVAGLRGAYHFNLGPDWDPYVGTAISWRRGRVTDGNRSEPKTKVGLHLVAGCRFYVCDWLGVFAEVGNDMLTKVNLGLTLRFGNVE